MRTTIVFTICFFLSFGVMAQDFDLIVRNKGDSIICKIDSISNTTIYFDLFNNGSWIKTFLDLADVAEYRKNFISKNNVKFTKEALIVNNTNSVRKNSIYFELGGTGAFWTLVSYDRLVPLGKSIAFVPRIGLSEYDGLYPVYELNIVFGGGKHFLEAGIGQYMFFNTIPERDFMIRTGYRYHGEKGFLFRIAPQAYWVYLEHPHKSGFEFWFGISFGYSF